MPKQELINELMVKIVEDDVASELRKTANNLVMGSGSLDAKLMIIGEAPGKKEDETGMPFVGQSGKFLDNLLASINLKRDDIYITNIVKYRPPENRDPSNLEKKEFWPYLLRQIAIIKPKLIATLGRHSGGYFISDLIMSRDHGSPRKISLMLENKETNLMILPLYHPAAALYNGSLKNQLFTDFLQIPKLIK